MSMSGNAKPAAIMGSLVNLKNVASHKSLALTVHVPAEAAQQVLAAFGWPTMVDPVPVAVARLEEAAAQAGTSEEPKHRLARFIADRAKQPEATQEEPPLEPRRWPDLTPAQQTGVIRNEPEFWEFTGVGAHGAEAARDYIRQFCHVDSCADIVPGTDAAARWAQLQVRYGNWLSQRKRTA